jgi:ribosome maturation factor RimP
MRPDSNTPPAEMADGVAGDAHDEAERRAGELARVHAVAASLCAAHGLELCEVAWSSDRGSRILKVIIDRPLTDDEPPTVPATGAPVESVGLEDCVRVSRELSSALDVDDVIEHAYTLEVSSPGLDRPLRSERDFRRQRGRLVKVRLIEPASDGQRVLRGTILEADSHGMSLEVDGNLHRVPFDNITEARLVFELGGQPKKGGRPRGKSRKR